MLKKQSMETFLFKFLIERKLNFKKWKKIIFYDIT